MLKSGKGFPIRCFLAVIIVFLVLYTVGCDLEDYFDEDFNDNVFVENGAGDLRKEKESLSMGSFDFDEYYEESEHLILAFYEVKKGNLKDVVKPKINRDLYEYFSDNMDYSLSELSTLRNEEDLFELLWEHVTYLVPEEYMERIKYFEVFTDGYDETLGTIEDITYSMDNGEEAFIFSLDILDMLDDDYTVDTDIFAGTVIHELGHIITLAVSQLNFVDYEMSDPKTYYLFDDEADTYPDSYLNLFFQKFWPPIYEEWEMVDYYEYEDEERYYDLLDEFYLKYEDQFVSDYAPTNPVEDIAESFMAFIMQDKPGSSLIREQKILFFYDFPEMVAVREHYRKNWL